MTTGPRAQNVRLQPKGKGRFKVLNSVSKYALHKILKILNISPSPFPPESKIGSQGPKMNLCVWNLQGHRNESQRLKFDSEESTTRIPSLTSKHLKSIPRGSKFDDLSRNPPITDQKSTSTGPKLTLRDTKSTPVGSKIDSKL